MALRRDYSLTKDFDFYGNADVYQLSQEYQTAPIPGLYFKNMLKYMVEIYRGSCR